MTANRNSDSVDDFVRERDEALRTLDLEWAMKKHPGMKPDVVLIAMHKTRYEATGIEPELRHASRHWLEEHGYHRIHMLPWPAKGELPK